MWWWILTILFFLISVVTSTIVFYSLKRINTLENIILRFQEIIEYSHNKLKTIDASGHFESDDEVGFVFDEIKSLQELLNGLFEVELGEEIPNNAKKES